jgi:hypothetical protein
MDSQPMTVTPASDLHPDVLALVQQISDEAGKLVAGIETLDANNWFPHADKIDSLNNQLQSLMIATPTPTASKSASSQTTSNKSSEGTKQ